MGGNEVVEAALRDLRERIANLDAGKLVATPAERYSQLLVDMKTSANANTLDSTAATSSHKNHGKNSSVGESRSSSKNVLQASEPDAGTVPENTQIPVAASVASTLLGSSASAGNAPQSASLPEGATLPEAGTATAATVSSLKAETSNLNVSVESNSNKAQQPGPAASASSSTSNSSQNDSAELLHLKSKHTLDHRSHDSPISKRPRRSRSNDRETPRDRHRHISSHDDREREREHRAHEHSSHSFSSSSSSTSSSSSSASSSWRDDPSRRSSGSHGSERADRHHRSDASSRSGKSRDISGRESSANKPQRKHKHATKSSGGSIIPKEYRNADPQEFKAFRLEVRRCSQPTSYLFVVTGCFHTARTVNDVTAQLFLAIDS